MKSLRAGFLCAALLSGCVSGRADHFYVLGGQPSEPRAAAAAPGVQAWLKVTLPSLVDRAEMVLSTSSAAVVVLEHERWAAPLSDLVLQALARDIERRRGDVMVSSRSVDSSAAAPVRIAVDIVNLSIRESGGASIEAQWHIVDPRAGTDVVERDVFTAPRGQGGYAAAVQALSECLGQLADRVAAKLPAPALAR